MSGSEANQTKYAGTILPRHGHSYAHFSPDPHYTVTTDQRYVMPLATLLPDSPRTQQFESKPAKHKNCWPLRCSFLQGPYLGPLSNSLFFLCHSPSKESHPNRPETKILAQ
eukprot:2717472-Amphidinium_carterae.1